MTFSGTSYYVTFKWNDNIEKFSGKLIYRIKKGTYYIQIVNNSLYGNGKFSFTATFPSSSSAKLTGIAVPMKVNGTMQLSALVSGTGGTVTWSSSNTSVATVSSSGKVTAKKKGTAVITAKLGDNSVSITIKVS